MFVQQLEERYKIYIHIYLMYMCDTYIYIMRNVFLIVQFNALSLEEVGTFVIVLLGSRAYRKIQ